MGRAVLGAEQVTSAMWIAVALTAWAIVFIGATATNFLYNSPGMWGVVLVRTVGHRFGNVERTRGRAVMLLCRSLRLLAAIFLIVRR